MKPQVVVRIFVLVILALSEVFTTFPASAQGNSAPAAANAVGFRAPFPKGARYMVTGTHKRAEGRHALDFGTPLNTNVLAMKDGTIIFANVDWTGGGNMIKIDHGDGTCSLYLHLNQFIKTSGYVRRGEVIALSGNTMVSNKKLTHDAPVHLHVSVFTCGNSSAELPIIFDEAGKELVYENFLTSQNENSDVCIGGIEVCPPKFPFGSNAKSRLFFDQGNERINLEVCADNLPGNTLYVKFSRPGKDWSQWNISPQTATGNCVTFWNLDGSGPAFTDVPYSAMVSMGGYPNTSWPVTGCLEASGRMGMCTQIQYPGFFVDQDPVACPASFTGWKSEYFNDKSLASPRAICKDEANLDLNWGTTGSPGPELNADNFSARFTKTLNLTGGSYTFYIAGDDGVRLSVDGNMLVDQWFDHGMTEYPANLTLTEGSHTIVAEYFEHAGGAAVKVRWDPPVEQSFTNGVTTPSIDVNSVNLKVCADNISGKTVFWQMWKSDQVWSGQAVANSSCISFTDMDGAGVVSENTPYYTVASLNPIGPDQAKLQRSSCAGTTGGRQLCDAVTYTPNITCTPGKSVDANFFMDTINNLSTQTEYAISNKTFAVEALQIWQKYEGTSACWNPLATTWTMPNSTNFNSVGVKNYALKSDGVTATANTVGTKNTAGNYSAIRQMLALKSFDKAALTANLQLYSGNGGYVNNLLAEWEPLYNKYAQTGVPTSNIVCPTSANVGTTFTCNLDVNPNGKPLAGLQVDISGFAGLLEHTGTEFSSLAGPNPINLSNNGKVIWAGSNGYMLTQTGTLATLTFKVVQAGNASLTSRTSAVGSANTAEPINPPNPVPITLPTQGSSTLIVSGSANLDSGINPARSTVALLDSMGQIMANVSPSTDGKYTFAAVQPGSYKLRVSAPGYLSAEKMITVSQAAVIPSVTLLAGDINADGKIDPLDVMSLGASYEVNPLVNTAADLNGDGVVNLLDLTLLAKNYQTAPIIW